MSIHWGGRGAGHISRLSTSTNGVPALALNFLSGTLDSRVSFSRASTATVIDSSGTIQSSPIDSPRFDFDPVTLTQRGLLMEEQRANLLTNSLITAVPLVTQSVTVTAVPHTLSFYGTGTITLTGASSATVVGTGVYPNRRTITFTPIAGVLICTVVGIVQFAQLEIGTFATSFIPTGASPVTRSADIANMTGTNFSSWYNQSEGTFVIDYDQIAANSAPIKALAIVSDGTSSNRIYGYISGTANPTLLVSNGGVAQANPNNGVITSGPAIKTAFGYKLNDFAIVTAGGAAATDNSGTVPLTTNRIDIGCFGTGTQTNGHLRQIAYYNTRLLIAKLQALTL